MNGKKEKILVCMSGGVDSSVVAALLVDAGYDVTGAYMINYDSHDDGFFDDSKSENCWIGDYRDATRVAAKLGIPLLKLDFIKEYRETVLKYMYDEYKKGRTPNPDVMCNRWIKFGFWLDKARELGFDKIATGHYALLIKTQKHPAQGWSALGGKNIKTQYELRQAKDKNKDQTYFLHQLNQEQLSHTLFPLGNYTKDEVRVLAEKLDLPTKDKEESMGICFLGEIDMKEFLKKEIKVKSGKIITSDGEVVGEHEGLAFYTIGERGVGLGSQKPGGGESKPLYVVDKVFDKNELVLGFEDDSLLFKSEIEVENVSWISGEAPEMLFECEVRLRHRQQMQNAKCKMKNNKLIVEFKKPQRAVTPGQFCVFYKNGECLGGGVVK